MLKRLIYIVLLVFVTFGVSLNASAADRWQWIKWNDNVDVFVDVQTIEYDYGFTFSDNTPPAVGATAWSKFVYFNENKVGLRQDYYSFKNNTVTLLSTIIYVNNEVYYSKTYEQYEREKRPIPPGTFAEAIKEFLIARQWNVKI